MNDEEGATVPTPIMKTAFIEDLVYPVGFVSYRNGFSIEGYYIPGGWSMPPLLQTFLREDSESTQNKRQEIITNKFLNKSIKILLPIEVNNKIREYIFIFKISNINFEKL